MKIPSVVALTYKKPLQEKPEMNLYQLQADAGENPLLGTWKLLSLVYETITTGQRSSTGFDLQEA
jgi:hypothetical protein